MSVRLGIIRNLPVDEYHADPAVSNTMLSTLKKSPAHCYALHLDPNRPKREPTAAMFAGTLAHTAILEPQAFSARYVVKPEGLSYASKDGKAWRDAQTLQIIDADDHATAQSQCAAVMRTPALADILRSGEAEVSVFWIDEATGLRCKARPDWLQWINPRRVMALDIKTIADLTPEAVTKAVTNYGYHRQRAHYVNGLRACGLQVDDFGFGFVSGSYPFIACGYLLDDETVEQGHDEVAELLDLFALCQRTGKWPAFGEGFQLTGLSKWARRTAEVEVSFVE